MDSNNIDVIGLGALNMDCLYRVDRILEDGEAVVNEAASFPGGSAANTIYGLARLGMSAGFAGAVGVDDEGKALIQDFQIAGVDTSQIKMKTGAKTGSVLCLSDNSEQRSLYVLPGANNLLTMRDIDLKYLNRAKLLHISSFAGEKQFQLLLELVNELSPSIRISFSPGAIYASKGIEALSPIIARSYVLFANEREIQQMTGQDIASGSETCLKRGCQMVVVTLGKGIIYRNIAAAAYIRDTGKEYIIPSSQKNTAESVDTTGAGDAFATGFLYGLLNKKHPDECGRLGDTTARFSITSPGARQGLPTANELSRRYRELY